MHSNDADIQALHNNAQQISEFLQLAVAHRFLAKAASNRSLLKLQDARKLQQLVTSQTVIIESAFTILRILLPSLKSCTEGTKELKVSLELQWVDFSCGLEMFLYDAKSIYFTNEAFSIHPNKQGYFFDWHGVETGIRTPLSSLDSTFKRLNLNNNASSAKLFSLRTEDAIVKAAMILHSLKTQLAVHAWSIENFSSFDLDSVLEKASAGPSIMIRILDMPLKYKIIIALFVLLSISLIIGIINFISI